MADRPLQFEIYRLNIVDEELLSFNFMGRNIRSDADIVKILEGVADSHFDLETASGRSTFRWAVREFTVYETAEPEGLPSVCSITLGRSILSESGQTVTQDRIEDALTLMSPPSADIIHLLFHMQRHLAIVEYSSTVMHSQLWRTSLHLMLDKAASSFEFIPGIRLEPVPRDEELIRAFYSFDRLIRLRVRLRIPNPELDRRTEHLRKEMVAGAIREYTQDMKNPAGLSTAENGLPYATVAMAQAGYKDGEIVMTGVRGGRKTTVRSGNRAARGRIDRLKDFMRGMASTARTAETKKAIKQILDEADRLIELPTPPTVEETGQRDA